MPLQVTSCIFSFMIQREGEVKRARYPGVDAQICMSAPNQKQTAKELS